MTVDRKESAATETLTHAVGRMLGVRVLRAGYQVKSLQGGTLGNVRLVSGNAETEDGRTLPYRIVWKTQKQWERPGDPDSWRREADLCQTDFQRLFTKTFRWPRRYHAEVRGNENHIWMETIEGRSGTRLTLKDLEYAAEGLGRFQGRCHMHSESLRGIRCLSDAGFPQREFAQWSPDTVEYRYLRSGDCELPQHLRQLLIDMQARSETIFGEMRRLPSVLCHRDYWTENIFVQDGGVVAIDWDGAGWGCIGEDIASLIADETEASRIAAYYQRLLPAYYRGLAEFMELPPMHALPIREIILLKFGYRLVQQVMFAQSAEPKAEAIRMLEAIDGLR